MAGWAGGGRGGQLPCGDALSGAREGGTVAHSYSLPASLLPSLSSRGRPFTFTGRPMPREAQAWGSKA